MTVSLTTGQSLGGYRSNYLILRFCCPYICAWKLLGKGAIGVILSNKRSSLIDMQTYAKEKDEMGTSYLLPAATGYDNNCYSLRMTSLPFLSNPEFVKKNPGIGDDPIDIEDLVNLGRSSGS